MGWERRTDGESETRGARVRVELPRRTSAPPDFSVLSEPSNTSVQGPATSIMLPDRKEGVIYQTAESMTWDHGMMQENKYEFIRIATDHLPTCRNSETYSTKVSLSFCLIHHLQYQTFVVMTFFSCAACINMHIENRLFVINESTLINK